jgi:predicted cupin superfamily sugar epimerase
MRTKELDKLGLDKLGREIDEAFMTARATQRQRTKTADYLRKRDTLIKYLREKTDESDWHGVSDAANDLRVLEAEHAK